MKREAMVEKSPSMEKTGKGESSTQKWRLVGDTLVPQEKYTNPYTPLKLKSSSPWNMLQTANEFLSEIGIHF